MKTKSMTKVLVTSALCALLTLSLTACGGDDKEQKDTDKPISTEQTEQKEQSNEKETNQEKEVASLSNVKYNPTDGTITGTITNNAPTELNSVALKGTIDYLGEDDYGKEVKQTYDLISDDIIFYSKDMQYALMGTTNIEANGKKDFICYIDNTRGGSYTAEKYDKEKISNPNLEIDYINVREDTSNKYWYASPEEYKCEVNYSNKSSERSVTITNNSDYQWEKVTIGFISNVDGKDVLESAKEFYIDKGATKTIPMEGSSIAENVQVAWVLFKPDNQ